jgi:hypothetical protein
VVPTRSVVCKFETNTLTANGGTSYNWGNAGTGTSVVVTLTTTSTYTVVGTDANGCSTTLLYLAKVSNCNGINEFTAAQSVNVYPNPSNGEFNVNSHSDITLNLINTIGQTVQTINVHADQVETVQVKNLSAGIYFLKGENNEGRVNVRLVITK